MEDDKVSIIIPYYNGNDFVEYSIESCYEQTYKNIEVIVVDDNSPIPFPEYLKDKFPQIKVIKNQQNCKFCKSANIGISNSSGKYIIVLGQDDILLKNHITQMLKSFSEELNVVAVYCGYHLIDENGNDYKVCRNNDERELRMLDMTQHAIHTCGLMMKRDAFLEVKGYPEEYGNFGLSQFMVGKPLRGILKIAPKSGRMK